MYFILWKGDNNQLWQFLESLNINERKIKFFWEIDNKSIPFLDLEIIQENNKLITKIHFKNVERNSYLPMQSCHHNN